jgi:A/G-specific adenine glycosylase
MTLSGTKSPGKPLRRSGRSPGGTEPAIRVPAGTPAPHKAAALLLAWYDRHRRHLAWRAEPGEKVDPYQVWLSEIMLQQTSVKTVTPYYLRFLARWPTLRRLALAPLEEVLAQWAGLGYYARARHLHACARAIVTDHDGLFPSDPKKLRALPGIGPYTAAAIAAIAFGRPEVPVDGNVERVMARLFALADPLPTAKKKLAKLARSLSSGERPGDFAQALMDLGAVICTPRRPLCSRCPFARCCAARAGGDAQAFPFRAVKPKTNWRRGAAFVVVRSDRSVLVRTRPLNGLLGGMTELPTTAWCSEFLEANALSQAPRLSGEPTWCRVPGSVTHTFSHFRLELAVYAAKVAAPLPAAAGMRWLLLDALEAAALPKVMRKVIALAMSGNLKLDERPDPIC